MQVNPSQTTTRLVDVRPEDLAADKSLTQRQKIAEASQQFESILLQQLLTELQKSEIHGEFKDNSTAASIYRSIVTKALADDISKSGGFGLAKVFERQLDPPNSQPKSGQSASSLAKPQPTDQTDRPISIFTKP